MKIQDFVNGMFYFLKSIKILDFTNGTFSKSSIIEDSTKSLLVTKLSIFEQTRKKITSPKSLVIPIDSEKRRIKLDQGLKMWSDGAASSAPASSCGCEDDLRQWVAKG